MQLVEGPVPSRRLGDCLRVAALRHKTCSYDCVYCMHGRTVHLQRGQRTYIEPAEVVAAVLRRLETGGAGRTGVATVAFGAEGEPTLDRALEPKIRQLRSFGLRVAVLTNASLLWREEVRRALRPASWVSVKVDTVDETVWRRLNRPHAGLALPGVLDGVRRFAGDFRGELATETMLVAGVNDDVGDLERTAELIAELAPRTAWLSTPTHAPAEAWVETPSREALEFAEAIFETRVARVRWLSPQVAVA